MKNIGRLIVIICFLFLIVPLVNALGSSGCCELPEGGGVCSVIEQSSCAEGSEFSKGVGCEETTFCQEGCCFDDDETTFKESLESLCSLNWEPDANCNLPAAEFGCCYLGSTVIYSNKGTCVVETKARGLADNLYTGWENEVSELECVTRDLSKDEGSCIFSDGECEIKTEEDCFDLRGKFTKGYLCTAEGLNTGCEPTTDTTCVSGKDEVYFLDSCGNPANIYDASKVNDRDYWEKIVLLEDSCGADNSSGNGESLTCGNCNRFRGGLCRDALSDGVEPDLGNNYCKSTECIVDGEIYEDGESWCDYEGKIGEGDDIVGSLHRRISCNQGVSKIEDCGDFRTKICVQKTTFDPEVEGVAFREAECVKNIADDCIAYGTDELDKCRESKSCFVKHVEISEFLNFDVCVPQYPKGFNLRAKPEHEEKTKAESVCGLATLRCNVIRGKFNLQCKDLANNECLTEKFTREMNDLCRSMGDCGLEISYVDEVTKNYEIIYQKNHKPSRIWDEINLGEEYIENILRPLLVYKKDQIVRAEDKEVSLELGRSSARLRDKFEDMLSGGLKFIGIDLRARDSYGKKISGGGSCPNKRVTYKCQPWNPPTGGERCEECNKDPLNKPCTEYRCNSLGRACFITDRETTDGECLFYEDDGIAPIVRAVEGKIGENAFLNSTGNTGKTFEITSASGACLDTDSDIVISITTNERSLCRYSLEKDTYDDMTKFGSGFDSFEHSLERHLDNPSNGVSQGLDFSKEFNFYIKCEDIFGHIGPVGIDNFLTIDLCIDEGDDTGAPAFRSVNPSNETVLGFDANETNIKYFTNELAICKWDKEDVDFEKMENLMTCEDIFGQPTLPGQYLCEGTLPVNGTDNYYYIRCIDQLWLEDIEPESRNANKESHIYYLTKPSEKISIEYIKPFTEIFTPVDKATVNIIIGTKGGGDIHKCSYSLSGFDNLHATNEVGNSKTHTKSGINLYTGIYHVYVECIDVNSGDTVQGETEFTITKDTTSPQIARVFQEDTTLTVITNEDAICKYTTTSCRYNFEDGIDIGSFRTHTITVTRGDKYYIKCKDEFENVPSACSIIVRAV
ncbi:MAG: hypothetical protein IH845_01650 [Nanoarchaeota archaeon]|nr:hypothetical protein [Nanoarchaeota archaeon]